MEARWRREFGGDTLGWDEAWLCGQAGYASFHRGVRLPLPGERYWMLDRVWLRPELRRRGLLTAVWPEWLERYGNFEVAAPNSEMRAFLAKVGAA